MSKRGQNEGSIFKRSDGRWTAIVSLGYQDGKRKRKSFYGNARKEVQEKLTEAISASQRGLPLANERQTVEQFFTKWLQESARPSIRPSTYTSYEGIVRLHIVPEIGRVPLARLTPQHIQSMLNAKLESGLSPRRVQYIHAVIRRALSQAKNWSLVPRNVAKMVTPPRVEKQEANFLTPEQTRIFLSAIKSDRLEAFYCLVITLGLRRGEALALQWEDIDLDNRKLRVRHTLQRVNGKLQLAETKTSKSRRTIQLPEITALALRSHRKDQLQERFAIGSQWKETSYVFTSTIGTPLDPDGVSKRFKKLLAQAGLPDMRFHDLRHTAASLLLSQGIQPRVVMEILGHSQISLTMNTYSHVIPALQQEAADKMDAILRG